MRIGVGNRVALVLLATALASAGCSENHAPAATGAANAGVPSSDVTRRRFPATATVGVSGALYVNRNTAIDRVSLDTVIKDESGTAVATKSSAASALTAGDSNERLFNVDVPLASLTPGQYVLVVNATLRGTSRAVAAREVRFQVAPD